MDVGQDTAEHFAAQVQRSKEELAEVFALYRRAHQGGAEDAEDELLADVIARCRQADERLDELVPRFDVLRGSEERAAEFLTRLDERTVGLGQRLAGASTTLEELGSQYPPGAVANFLDDLDQAYQRLQFAAASVAIGRQLLADGDGRGAVARARAAEEALGQASSLLDWVDGSPQVLVRAREVVATLLEEVERDIADAERLGVTGDLAARGHYARETLGWVGKEVASGEYDPLATRRALEDTNAALGRALGPVRTQDEAHQRAAAAMASAWYAARATLGSADRFVMTRRGAVGVEARSRLAQAGAAYAQGIAIGDADPMTALQRLRTADVLAEQARALAQHDEAAYRNTRRIAGGMDELGTMVLGGILIEQSSGLAAGGSEHPELRGAKVVGPVSFGGRATRGRLVGAGHFE